MDRLSTKVTNLFDTYITIFVYKINDIIIVRPPYIEVTILIRK